LSGVSGNSKQAITSYEDTQLRSYRQQITGRLRQTVRLVRFTSTFLIGTS
jgi:hypothetical protein